MSRRSSLVAAVILPVTLVACAPTESTDVIVETRYLVCPAEPPDPFDCAPPGAPGAPLAERVLRADARAACWAELVEAWTVAWGACSADR